ncbi:hypothetical protein [Hymenobacter algoricola]|uniref:RCC1 domain-containing protein n=1 Tax=Hymenobacter algoricola TaxID=486267 RepID=UPI0031E9C8E3
MNFKAARLLLFSIPLLVTDYYACAQGAPVAIKAGGNSSMALHADGTLWEWGAQYDTYPANATVSQLRPRLVPTPASAALATTWTTMGVGDDHECAIRTDGTLWAWGYNNTGQLGDGTTIDRFAPVLVAHPANATPGTFWSSVTAVSQVTLAQRSDSTLWAWGSASKGLLATGTLNGVQLQPIIVPVPATYSGTHWSQVAASNGHVLALLSNGTLWAWGTNNFGQLGTQTVGLYLSTPTLVSVPATGSTRWIAIAAGKDHSLALRSDGTLWSWGENGRGQTGAGTVIRNLTATEIPVPATAAPGTRWARIAAGEEHSLALLSDGTLWGWGRNSEAQLGDNSATDRRQPVQEFTRGRWSQIAGGTMHSLALAQGSSRVFATGAIAPQRNVGQLGDGTLNGSLYYRPSLVTPLPVKTPLVTQAKLFPNPAHDWVTLEGVAPGTKVLIYNALGQQVKIAEISMMGIELRGLVPGRYWIITQPLQGNSHAFGVVKE